MTAKIKRFLAGWSSIYDLNPTINNPYMDEREQIKSTEQLIYEHWQSVGNYIKSAMFNFENEQAQQK